MITSKLQITIKTDIQKNRKGIDYWINRIIKRTFIIEEV